MLEFLSKLRSQNVWGFIASCGQRMIGFYLVAFAVDWVVFGSVIQPLSYDTVTCVLNGERD